ncbi:hypothetical protein B5F17_11435 [Butyricicoccus pullicaecorum]|uniref:HTH araC/xylS-type domain-containing protein n=1 Tax=Butyricicoccus pullicaecorum TaxID=501571 RepID=A0A1Y4L507_9FIRM|nr:helix-turn-helix domain-containing protein [Butyricicoccus pullicaecorum]OUP51853.1 hypothetical protein B5F17_11435 [Butyricicoccus pullicaecorum]
MFEHRGNLVMADLNCKELIIYIREITDEEKHAHREIEIDYILYGAAELVLSGDIFHMKKGDIILINSNKLHWWKHAEKCLICRILISSSMMEEMLGRRPVNFWCNSVTNSVQDVHQLRVTLNTLIKKYRAAGERNSFSLECAKYSLLDILSENFLLEANEISTEDQRIQQTLDDINNHYAERLSLTQIADRLYLSEAYLSRLFKQTVGMNFREYLSRVRLNHAVESLLYTCKTVTEISMECGFETPSAFNKLFQRNYQCSPSEYRRQIRKRASDAEKSDISVMEKLDSWLKDQAIPEERAQTEVQQIEIDRQSGRPLQNNTISWINFGTMWDLLQAVLQEQLVRIHRTLGVRYVRLGNIFSQSLHIRQGNQYTFALMDTVLDFIVDNGMIPVLDLTVHLKRAYADIGEDLFREENQVPFQDLRDWKVLLDTCLAHLAERYGRESLEEWIFELDESEEYQDICEMFGKPYVPYAALWSTARSVLHRFCPEAAFGGSPALLKNAETIPDFVTGQIYPYSTYHYGKDVYSGRITDLQFVECEVKKLRKMLREAGYPDMKLVITEWNTSISERNAYNDGCGKAAHVMMHLAALEGECCILCYQHGSDFLTQYRDTTEPFVGGNGLLTKDGVHKPVFYAFQFMSQMKGQVVAKGEHFLVTCNRGNTYFILAFHPKKFGHVYYLNKESQIREEMDIYEENTAEKLCFRILNRPERRYRMKTWYMTEEQGSAVYEWRQMGRPAQLNADEARYLRELSRPRIQKQTGRVQDGEISVELVLKPHQITLVQVVLDDGEIQ